MPPFINVVEEEFNTFPTALGFGIINGCDVSIMIDGIATIGFILFV